MTAQHAPTAARLIDYAPVVTRKRRLARQIRAWRRLANDAACAVLFLVLMAGAFSLFFITPA